MDRKVFSRISILVAIFGSTVIGSFVTSTALAKQDRVHPSSQTAQGRSHQPNMQQVLSSLKEAEKSLEQATPDKGGHRVKALELVQQATKETQLGIEFDRTHSQDGRKSQNTPRSARPAPRNVESYPSMQQALSELLEAQAWLQQATPDKGGHRVKAIALVQQAIKETQLGIEFDRTHRNDEKPGLQPYMQQALSSLKEAEKSLEQATPEKKGHRVKALELVKQATKETQLGIGYDRTHSNDVNTSQNTSRSAQPVPRNGESYPNMRQALSELLEAQTWLQKATPDKGGHRVKAIALVQQAIKETQRGIEFARTHVQK